MSDHDNHFGAEKQEGGCKPIPILATAAIALYCGFTLVSYAFYPAPFSPTRNFLSQLGNMERNPGGWIYYNLAVITAGVAIIPFYIAMYRWYSKKRKSKLLVLATAVGLVNGTAIAMSGVFSESINYSLHVFSSYVIFISFAPVLFLFTAALMSVPGQLKAISCYGLVAGIVDLAFVIILQFVGFGPGLGALMEWVVVFSYLVWVGLLAYQVRRHITAVRVTE